MEQHDDHDYDHAATRTTKTTTTITTITKNIPPKDTAGRRGQNATCWWGSHEVPQRFPHELAGFRAAKMPSSMRRVQTHDHHAFPNDPKVLAEFRSTAKMLPLILIIILVGYRHFELKRGQCVGICNGFGFRGTRPHGSLLNHMT